jgi:hypothetical protein
MLSAILHPGPQARALAWQPSPPGGQWLSPRMTFVEKRPHRRGPRAMAKNCPSLIGTSRLRVKSVISAQPDPRPQAHAGTRAHAGARPSAHLQTRGASPDGPAHGRWPTRITKLVGRRESLCASFVPSCLCGWPWLPGYNY